MAATGRMHVSIDVERYHRLPPGVRATFDGWLEAVGLKDKKVVELTLAEGYVTIQRMVVDDEGQLVLDETGEGIVLTTERVPVPTLPPREAFDAD